MSLQDSLFSEDVECDVTAFSKDKRRKRVLVFPPVNNYRRFIIHQLVQDRFADLLHTFSIGQGANRRTVVCYKCDLIRDPKLNGAEFKTQNSSTVPRDKMGVEGRESSSAATSPEHLRAQRQVKTAASVEIYRPPAARRSRDSQAAVQPITPIKPADFSCSSVKSSSRQRRPDRAVYVPKHRRSSELEGSPQPVERHRPNRLSEHSTIPTATSGLSSNVSVHDGEPASTENITETKKDGNRLHLQSDSKSSTLASPVVPVADESLFKQEDVGNISETTVQTCEANSVKNEKMVSIDRKHTERLVAEEKMESSESAEFVMVNNLESSLAVEGGKESMNRNSIERHDENIDDKEKRLQSNAKNRDMKQEVSTNEINNKNKNKRPVIRGNVISDVLIISESAKKEQENNAINSKQLSVGSVTTTPPGKKPKKVERLKSKPAPPPSPPPVKMNRDECDWDSLFDDNGDCLDPTLIDELTSAVGEVVIDQPKNDYKAYTKQVEVSSDEFAHVVEIYNFPSDFKTSDLAAVFSPFKNGGFELKWVDDTHCLGVFSSPLIAAEVLASNHPFVKTRPLSEATALSKTKARRSAEFLQPYRSRPETCAALARRLVTGALGVKLATARQEREREKIVLREAKEKRRLANKQREDAWEGIIPEK